ncbi:MAG: transposase [Planctomycetes bacterium]|nr:transposase [Planctomycetota bacterium]
MNVPATWGRGRAVRLPDPELYASDTPIHLTIGADHGSPFAAGQIATLVCDSVEKSSELLGFRLYVYCLMPDHVHAMVSAGSTGRPISEFLQRMKSFTTRRYQALTGRRRLWQASAFDRVSRPGEDLATIVRYIADNPVRRGLVACWADWPHTRVFVDL